MPADVENNPPWTFPSTPQQGFLSQFLTSPILSSVPLYVFGIGAEGVRGTMQGGWATICALLFLANCSLAARPQANAALAADQRVQQKAAPVFPESYTVGATWCRGALGPQAQAPVLLVQVSYNYSLPYTATIQPHGIRWEGRLFTARPPRPARPTLARAHGSTHAQLNLSKAGTACPTLHSYPVTFWRDHHARRLRMDTYGARGCERDRALVGLLACSPSLELPSRARCCVPRRRQLHGDRGGG